MKLLGQPFPATVHLIWLLCGRDLMSIDGWVLFVWEMLEVSLDEDVFHTWEPWTQPFNTFTLLFVTAFCCSQIKPSPWTNENYKRKNKRRASRRSIISCSRTSVLGWLGSGVPLVQRRGGGGAAAFASRIHQSHLLPSASLDHSTESLGMARRLMSTTMDTLFRASLLLGLLLAISGSSLALFWMTYNPIGWTTFEFTFLCFEGTLVISQRNLSWETSSDCSWLFIVNPQGQLLLGEVRVKASLKVTNPLLPVTVRLKFHYFTRYHQSIDEVTHPLQNLIISFRQRL